MGDETTHSELCCSLKRVRKTSCGYVVTQAKNFANAAAAKTLLLDGGADNASLEEPLAAVDAAASCAIALARKFS